MDEPSTVKRLERVASRVWNKDGRVTMIYEDDKNGAGFTFKLSGFGQIEPWRVDSIKRALRAVYGGWNSVTVQTEVHVWRPAHEVYFDPDWNEEAMVDDSEDKDDFNVVED
jgi:hypothetical protein